MELLALGLGLMILFGAFGAGRSAENKRSGDRTPTGPAPEPSGEECHDACKAWLALRVEYCARGHAYTIASDRAQSAGLETIAAYALAAIALGIAFASLLIPIVGWGISVALFISAASLLTYATYLFGVSTAAKDLADKAAAALTEARDKMFAQEDVLNSKCSGDALTECYARALPC